MINEVNGQYISELWLQLPHLDQIIKKFLRKDEIDPVKQAQNTYRKKELINEDLRAKIDRELYTGCSGLYMF